MIEIDSEIKWKNWRTLKICFLDTETTSVKIGEDEFHIVQFAAKIHEGGIKKCIGKIDILIRPPISIPEGSSKVHRIYDHHVSDKPMFPDVADRIIDFICAADVCCAYNHRFDLNGLNCELTRAGRPNLIIPFIDPLIWERETRKKFSQNKLADAARRWYCSRSAAVQHGDGHLHDALVDVEVLAELTYNMAEGGNGRAPLPFSLNELIEKQEKYEVRQEDYLAKKYGK
jgi:DNA polymerase III epsilon subunit-like protein